MAKKKTIKSTVKRSSASDILGGQRPAPTRPQTDICYVCEKKIPAERITALKSLGIPNSEWTHAKCSTTQKIKGIYTGEVGTSKLLLVDKLYDDSVRSIFRRTEVENRESNTDSDEETLRL